MIILCFAIVFFTVVGMAWLSRRAATQLSQHDRLPMQWGLTGRPTWYAPRRIALAFAPVLAAITMIFAALVPELLSSGTAMSKNEWLALVVVLIWMGAAWLAAHVGYLWLVRRWARQSNI